MYNRNRLNLTRNEGTSLIKINKILAAGALSIFAFSAVGCNMIAKTPEAIANTVVAKVGDLKVTKGEVEEVAGPVLEQYYGEDYESNTEAAETVKNFRTQALNLLVEQKLLEIKAKEMNILPTDEEINKEVNEYLESMQETYGGEEGFNSALEQAGLTLEEYKENLTKNIRMQLISEKVTDDMFKDITVADEEIKTYYNENTDSFKSATVSHILVSDEAKANELRERALKGEDFATLAKENSEDTGTKEKGGSLGTVTYDSTQYVTEFMTAVKALKEGEISEPVKSTYGYHIIKAENVKVDSLEDKKEEIKTTLENEKKNELYTTKIEEWKEQYKVKTYEGRL
ncbi:peptidylprolyl isomerase [Clostridium isatidis]|uniref:peptidylprolyl isomerase n=1 Tax=Clostridium isatidis TaxID=182773 RepID=UPI001F22872F|nr:peptidylprolyl isomerase [Clostridium isatidis]